MAGVFLAGKNIEIILRQMEFQDPQLIHPSSKVQPLPSAISGFNCSNEAPSARDSQPVPFSLSCPRHDKL
jgi:hypothetical protein